MPRDKKTRPQTETEGGPESGSESGASVEASASPRTVSKAHAVRTALAQGYDGPQEAVAFIKRRFGIEMERQQFSAYKSQLRKKEREAEPEPSARKRSSAIEGYLAPPPKPSAGADSGGETNLLAALETMKPLIAQYGAEKVKRIVDLLG